MTIQQHDHLEMALTERLKSTTSTHHDRMEVLMEKAQVFESKENYIQFTLAQYYFQKVIEHLYTYPEIAHIIPDLEIRGRSKAALQDLKDLGVNVDDVDILTIVKPINHLHALGWIYVSEGSTLGAAFLFKEAQQKLGLSENFGASNLAAYPEGRMRVWKRYKHVLDDAQLSLAEQNQVLEGAVNGFHYFGQLLEQN